MDNLTKARNLIKNSRLFSYEVAGEIGIAPTNFSTWFRNENSMSDERYEKIAAAVQKLLEEKNE